MKKLLILLFSIIISFNSYGEFVEVTESADGSFTSYIDIATIKENNGYVYYWVLRDKLVPNKYGDFSVKLYFQVDCEIIKEKILSFNYFKQPMGQGDAEISTPSDPEWMYPPANSIDKRVLDYACDYAK